MDREVEQEEVKPLLFNYIFHLILYALIFAMHLVMYARIFWIFDSLGILFLFGSYFNILYFIFPVFPIIIIILRKYKVKIINSIKKITLILLIITITLGLMISVVLLLNSINSKLFCKECPFNLRLSHLNAIFGQYYGQNPDDNDDINDKCNSRRCVLDHEESDEKYPYIYLCNYNPTEEFSEDELYKRRFSNGTEISTNIQLICQSVTSNYNLLNFDNHELYSYLDLCYYLADFYYCSRFNKPEKYYNLDLKAKCPESNYLLLIFILSVLIIIIDIIIALLPWGVEYMSLKKLISILSTTRRKTNSHNSTARSSQISNNEESFHKEKTPVLIISANNNKEENNDDMILQLKKSVNKENNNNRIKINKMNFEENENNNNIKQINPINLKTTQNSERKILNPSKLEIDTEINKDNINRPRQRNIIEQKNEENTTLYGPQIKQININIEENIKK